MAALDLPCIVSSGLNTHSLDDESNSQRICCDVYHERPPKLIDHLLAVDSLVQGCGLSGMCQIFLTISGPNSIVPRELMSRVSNCGPFDAGFCALARFGPACCG